MNMPVVDEISIMIWEERTGAKPHGALWYPSKDNFIKCSTGAKKSSWGRFMLKGLEEFFST